MRRSWAGLLMAVAMLVGPGAVHAEAPTEPPELARLATPEDAIRAYLQGVTDGDPDAILAASAAERMAAGYRFDLDAGRMQSWVQSMPFPAEHRLLAAADQRMWESDLLRKVGFLAYSLLTDIPLDGRTVGPVDQAWGERIAADLDPERLANLVVVDIRPPDSFGASPTRLRVNQAARAAVMGADDSVERVALVSFENRLYAIGFSLLRYGDEWRVRDQDAYLPGYQGGGMPIPITPDEYDAMTVR